MKLNKAKFNTKIRKWSRYIHRDLSFFLAGIIIIYAFSGLAMNHRDSFNPDYSIEKINFTLEKKLPEQSKIDKASVIELLETIDAEDNYTKHYFPKKGIMKVFLKGGSNLVVNLNTQKAVYEKLERRPILSAMTSLHYNPGRWWTYFADFFAIGLLVITFTGIIMVKGKKGLWGQGGIELIIGILIPLAFLFL